MSIKNDPTPSWNPPPTPLSSGSYGGGSAIWPNVTNPTIDNNLLVYSEVLKNNGLDKELKASYSKFLKWQIDTHKKEFKQRKIMGIIIFSFVCALTLAGITFSAIQLFTALRLGVNADLSTEFAVRNFNEIYFKTTFVGGLVLLISVVFFFLFLKYVYSTNTSSGEIFNEIRKAIEFQKK